jgi:hypothetical protein
MPDSERRIAFAPAPWLSVNLIDVETRQKIALAVEFLRIGVTRDRSAFITDAAWYAAQVTTPKARTALLDRIGCSPISTEHGLLALLAIMPGGIAPLVVCHIAGRISRLERNAHARALPLTLRAAASPFERALFDEGVSLSERAPQRRRVLIDASRATIRAALQSPATVPSCVVDARLRTLVHLGGERAIDALVNALDLAPPCEHTERTLDALCELDAARAATHVIERAALLRGRCGVLRMLQAAEVRGGLPAGFSESYRTALVTLARNERDGHAWLARLARAWQATRGRSIDAAVLRWVARQPVIPLDPDELLATLPLARSPGTHIDLLAMRTTDPSWLARQQLLGPARIDPQMRPWTDWQWEQHLDLAASYGKILPNTVTRCARLLRLPTAALLSGDLGTCRETTFITDGSAYRVRLLDKRDDLLTYLRFADVPARSCYRSDSDTYDCWCHGTKHDTLASWKDPLTLCLRIERQRRGIFEPNGFFVGSFAIVRRKPALVMNALHVRPQTAAVRFPIIAFLEREVCEPLGIEMIGIANTYNGRGPMPAGYAERTVELERLRALRTPHEPNDDTTRVVNAVTQAQPLFWRYFSGSITDW